MQIAATILNGQIYIIRIFLLVSHTMFHLTMSISHIQAKVNAQNCKFQQSSALLLLSQNHLVVLFSAQHSRLFEIIPSLYFFFLSPLLQCDSMRTQVGHHYILIISQSACQMSQSLKIAE